MQALPTAYIQIQAFCEDSDDYNQVFTACKLNLGVRVDVMGIKFDHHP